MDEELTIPGSPEDWLRYARSDLVTAGMQPKADLLAETLCFHMQQAAEKTLKAILVAYDLDFPWTHNLRTLIDLKG